MTDISHPYRGRNAVLATKHDKLGLIGPSMFRRLGLVVETAEVDTDLLGTFAGEVPRRGSQLEVVEAKARMGMRATGRDIGLASEGSFGPLWGVPLLTADVEMVMLVDDALGITVYEVEVDYDVVTFGVELSSPNLDDVDLGRAGFPEHGLIVRPKSGSGPIFKGIHDPEELDEALRRSFVGNESRTVCVESDLRAHHHPSRRRVIAKAADRLVDRLARLCPSCRTPGWGIGRQEAGAPCRVCNTPTRLLQREILVCARCDVEVVQVTAESNGVDPQYCPRCNP